MKQCFLYGILSVLIIWSFSGCTSSVRYTPDEIKGYPQEMQDNIQQGNVVLGMTPPQVRYAWGPPTTINVIAPLEDGKPREEWLYSSMGVFMQRRLLFIDGKVADIFPVPKRTVDEK